jgi:hypothetical protein
MSVERNGHDVMQPGGPWVEPGEFAKAFHVTTRTVWRWVKLGHLEVRRIGPQAGVRVRRPPAAPSPNHGGPNEC